MLNDKTAKLSSTLFIALMMVAMAGVAIMNSQLEEANNITGMTVKEKNWQPFTASIFILLAFIMGIFLITSFVKPKQGRDMKAINKDIQKLEQSLKELER